VTTSRIAVIGAGPVGLALALHARSLLPQARLTVYDARPPERDVAGDARTLALSLGSLMFLERLGLWPGELARRAAPIAEVHVSQTPAAFLGARAQPEVTLSARELGVPQLGAVLGYGALLAPMQQAWFEAVAAEPRRLEARFGRPVAALKPVAGGVEVDAGVAETFDLAVVAEGGVFAEQARKALARDYGQTAWVGEVTLAGGTAGVAFERFTPDGPLALLPLPPLASRDGDGEATQDLRAALVWCAAKDADAMAALDDAQRAAVLASLLPTRAGRVRAVSPLRAFALGLNAERSLVQGRVVRIGNAAQTLHPVAGQGLNLGLRDVHALVTALRGDGDVDAALRRVAWTRAPDRWSTIAATDLLARGFTWQWPGAAALRGLALKALDAATPLKARLARQMMYGWR
jgi:2-octaprenyl-6-methoxyphenol hydroxylase